MLFNTIHIPANQVTTQAGGVGSNGFAKLQAVAAAVVLCTGLSHVGEAQALALGRIAVQSALGEPLRAEIDVPDISPEEAASLRVGLGSSSAFRSAGMEFNPALTDLKITLQRRPNGTAYLRLTSSRPINEPFLDMIVEASWASGNIMRDYTLLLDPPNLRALAPVAPLPPAVTAQSAPQLPAPPTLPAAPVAQSVPVAPAVRPAAPVAQAAPATQVPKPAESARPASPVAQLPAPIPREPATDDRILVRPGDTAGRIAAANQPANVSLDQMLVAMLRANPNAFVAGNVNRLKAGAVIDMPSADDARQVASTEARQVIAAQSRDFNEFRRRLAGIAPATTVAAADRQAEGKIQTEVQDAQPAAPTQDKLTLSKGATSAQALEADKLAQERQAKEAAARKAELSKNIEELSQLSTGAAPATATAAGTAPATAGATAPPSSALPAPTLTVPNAPPLDTATPGSDQAPAPSPTETTAPVAPESETQAQQASPGTPADPVVEQPSFIDGLRDNPLILPAAGGLLALLAGLAFYRSRQRKKSGSSESSFLESRLQPDSFFGASGGQRIDTAESRATGSSMAYSPSQLDAGGDVDPVAEADVYLAYGRDLQAEEILKEAMRSTPQRVAIHNKLLEIYAKRRDPRAFEVIATEAYNLTQGKGSEWEQASELGRELDPANPLYQPGGKPAAKAGAAAAAVASGTMDTMPFGSNTLVQPPRARSGLVDSDLDLDLDLDLNTDSASRPAQLRTSAGGTVSALDDLSSTEALTSLSNSKSGPPSGSMDFGLDFPSERGTIGPASSSKPADLRAVEPQNKPITQTNLTEAQHLSFALNDINLDLEDQSGGSLGSTGQLGGQAGPLDTKLSLAEEFRAIGDLEGARALAEEVLSEGDGALKSKARTFLANLS